MSNDISGADALAACRALGIPVPDDFKCPACGAKPGQLCRHPSGHQAQDAHEARYDLAGGRQLSDQEWDRVIAHLTPKPGSQADESITDESIAMA